MRCGLFGKLPAKRDFVTVAAPRAFLRVWEPWLDRGLAECRRRLAPEEWARVFDAGPVWRFWLGEDVCGIAVVGAFIASIDACGRQYPLTLIGVAEAGEAVVPPFVDPLVEWFERAEAFLVSSTDPNTSFERVSAALAALAPLPAPAPDGNRGADRPGPGSARNPVPDGDQRERFARLAASREASGLASRTAWWSLEPDAAEPLVRIDTDMPDPVAFTDMMTVHLVPRTEPAIGIPS